MRRNLIITAMIALLALPPLIAQGTGRIEGRVQRDNGSGIGGVTVVVSELGMVEITDNNGSFAFDDVADGTYTIQYSLGDDASSQTVEVAGGTTEANETVDWDISFVETITVYSASRRRERIVDAPAAITVVNEAEISTGKASTGQVAKVLEFTPGVEIIAERSLRHSDLNTRGFNSSLNRRVQTADRRP